MPGWPCLPRSSAATDSDGQLSEVIDHVEIRVSDLAASRRMYEAALAEIGFVVLSEGEFEGDAYALFGRGESDDFGLHTTLVNYVEEWSERSGVGIDFHSTGLDGKRLPSPNAFSLTLSTGAAWRRLYSLATTMRSTRRTIAAISGTVNPAYRPIEGGVSSWSRRSRVRDGVVVVARTRPHRDASHGKTTRSTSGTSVSQPNAVMSTAPRTSMRLP